MITGNFPWRSMITVGIISIILISIILMILLSLPENFWVRLWQKRMTPKRFRHPKTKIGIIIMILFLIFWLSFPTKAAIINHRLTQHYQEYCQRINEPPCEPNSYQTIKKPTLINQTAKILCTCNNRTKTITVTLLSENKIHKAFVSYFELKIP